MMSITLIPAREVTPVQQRTGDTQSLDGGGRDKMRRLLHPDPLLAWFIDKNSKNTTEKHQNIQKFTSKH